METAPYIWLDGEFVAWDDAQVHVLTHALHYGTGVFEGVRCYDTEIGPAVFRHPEHIERLFASAKLYYLHVPFTREEIRAATLELINRNEQRECYIRPLVFRGDGEMGLFAQGSPMRMAIASWKWDSLLGDKGQREGVRAKVSSWRRTSHHSLIRTPRRPGTTSTACSPRTRSRAAATRTARSTTRRRSSSTSAASSPRAPARTCSSSRAARSTRRRRPRASSMASRAAPSCGSSPTPATSWSSATSRVLRPYLADEVFMTGTAAELVPVVEIDDIAIGDGTRAPSRRRSRRSSRTRSRARRALHGLARPGPGTDGRVMRAATLRPAIRRIR